MSITPGTSKNHTVRSSGFTLVELLAVMLILAILMTLVVGASKLIFNNVYIDETKTNMKIIMVAVREYQKARDKILTDADTGNDKDYPELSNSNWITQLKAKPETMRLIGKLPETVWNAKNNNEFLDSWGNPIRYSQRGGLAGTPGLTSGGPDGKISDEDDNVYYSYNNKR